MKYRFIDHGRVSRGLQCAGDCSKCDTSTSSRRIDFVTPPGESDFMAERTDLIATIKTTFISPDETLSCAKGKRAAPLRVCTRREIQDDILQDKRAAMLQLTVRALIGIGSNEAVDRSRAVLYEAVDTTPRTHAYIRWTSYNSGCPTKKQRRYLFAKHKLARSPNGGIRAAFYNNRDPLSTILNRNCRVESDDW